MCGIYSTGGLKGRVGNENGDNGRLLITISKNFEDGRKINGQNKDGNEPCISEAFSFYCIRPNYRLFQDF